ncbi:MAG: T9SS type A sorting domain-containing protein [Bacteroidota bacterium]
MKKLILLLSFVFIFNYIHAQQTEFVKYYGESCPDFGMSIDETSDGGYILLGHTQNYGAIVQDILLIKIDSLGNTEWQKLFGGNDYDFGQSVQQTNDNGFIICGFTSSYGAGGTDIYLIKTDSFGNMEWEKTYGGTNNDYGYYVKQTNDNGFILCGSTRSFGAGNSDGIIIKVNDLGIQQWSKYIGGANNDGIYALDIINDGYILTGYTENFGAQNTDAMLIKIDLQGNQKWLKIFGGMNNERAMGVKFIDDNSYVIAGYTNSFGNGSDEIYLVKTDSAGNEIFSKTYGGSLSDKGFSLDLTSDKGFVILGQTSSFGLGLNDMYIVKTNSLGNIIWEKYYGGVDDDSGIMIKTTKDNGFIAIGNTLSNLPDWMDIMLVKMDSTGYANSIFSLKANNLKILVYPNPVIDKIIVESKDESAGIITILDIQGRNLLSIDASQKTNEINISNLSKGIYFLKYETRNGIFVKKFVKE